MAVDFATLIMPKTPNSWLAAPSWAAVSHADERIGGFAVTPEELLRTLLDIARGEPRTEVTNVADGRAELVQRSALFRFPDKITLQVLEAPDGGAGVIVWSRSVVGRSDLGVNRKRVRRWLAEVARRLGAAR